MNIIKKSKPKSMRKPNPTPINEASFIATFGKKTERAGTIATVDNSKRSYKSISFLTAFLIR
jgi:hypothetical protein